MPSEPMLACAMFAVEGKPKERIFALPCNIDGAFDGNVLPALTCIDDVSGAELLPEHGALTKPRRVRVCVESACVWPTALDAVQRTLVAGITSVSLA